MQDDRNIQFSLGHLSALDLTPTELVIAAAKADYNFVGLRLVAVTPNGAAWPLWKDRKMMAGTRARMAESGVGVLDVELIKLMPDTDVRTFEPCMQAAADLGARHLLTQVDDPEFWTSKRLVLPAAGVAASSSAACRFASGLASSSR